MKSGDVVCAAKLDRLFRSASDALNTVEAFQKKGIKVILADISSEPVTENGVAKLFFTILSAVAEFEWTRIEERTSSGRAAKKAQFNGTGLAGGPPPRGYRRVGLGREARLEPDENEQKLVAEVRELAKEIASPSLTPKIINNKGFRDRKGSEFRVPQIQRLVARL